jgi:glycosyltransferase involved in cell wall biosynthesis
MRTIAVFHPSSELYGADRILVHAINAFPADHRPVVYLRCEGPLLAFIAEHAPQAEVRMMPDMPVIYRAIFTPMGIVGFMRQWFRFAAIMRKEHREHRFTLAYVNTLSCSFLLPLLWWMRIERFIHVHEIIDAPKLIGWTTAMLARVFATRVVCVSEAVRQGLVRYAPRIAAKSVVLHNGIDPVHADARAMDGTVHFTLFGRIKPEKGHWFLIEALTHMDRALLQHAHFTLMGGVVQGQEQVLEALQARIHAAGLAQHVTIRGFAANISEAMAATDVCLVPSMMRDPFPTTVLEAMSAGRPVITTDHGGAREAMVHGSSGFLVSPGDAKQLAHAIAHYLRQPLLVREHGAAASQRFAGAFTRAAFNQRWAELCATLKSFQGKPLPVSGRMAAALSQ